MNKTFLRLIAIVLSLCMVENSAGTLEYHAAVSRFEQEALVGRVLFGGSRVIESTKSSGLHSLFQRIQELSGERRIPHGDRARRGGITLAHAGLILALSFGVLSAFSWSLGIDRRVSLFGIPLSHLLVGSAFTALATGIFLIAKKASIQTQHTQVLHSGSKLTPASLAEIDDARDDRLASDNDEARGVDLAAFGHFRLSHALDGHDLYSVAIQEVLSRLSYRNRQIVSALFFTPQGRPISFLNHARILQVLLSLGDRFEGWEADRVITEVLKTLNSRKGGTFVDTLTLLLAIGFLIGGAATAIRAETLTSTAILLVVSGAATVALWWASRRIPGPEDVPTTPLPQPPLRIEPTMSEEVADIVSAVTGPGHPMEPSRGQIDFSDIRGELTVRHFLQHILMVLNYPVLGISVRGKGPREKVRIYFPKSILLFERSRTPAVWDFSFYPTTLNEPLSGFADHEAVRRQLVSIFSVDDRLGTALEVPPYEAKAWARSSLLVSHMNSLPGRRRRISDVERSAVSHYFARGGSRGQTVSEIKSLSSADAVRLLIAGDFSQRYDLTDESAIALLDYLLNPVDHPESAANLRIPLILHDNLPDEDFAYGIVSAVWLAYFSQIPRIDDVSAAEPREPFALLAAVSGLCSKNWEDRRTQNMLVNSSLNSPWGRALVRALYFDANGNVVSDELRRERVASLEHHFIRRGLRSSDFTVEQVIRKVGTRIPRERASRTPQRTGQAPPKVDPLEEAARARTKPLRRLFVQLEQEHERDMRKRLDDSSHAIRFSLADLRLFKTIIRVVSYRSRSQNEDPRSLLLNLPEDALSEIAVDARRASSLFSQFFDSKDPDIVLLQRNGARGQPVEKKTVPMYPGIKAAAERLVELLDEWERPHIDPSPPDQTWDRRGETNPEALLLTTGVTLAGLGVGLAVVGSWLMGVVLFIAGAGLLWSARGRSAQKQATPSKSVAVPHVEPVLQTTTDPKDLILTIMELEESVLDDENHPLSPEEWEIMKQYAEGTLSLDQAASQIKSQMIQDSVSALVGLALAHRFYPQNPLPAATFLFHYLKTNPTPTRRAAELMGSSGIERTYEKAFMLLSEAAARYESYFRRGRSKPEGPHRDFGDRRGKATVGGVLLTTGITLAGLGAGLVAVKVWPVGLVLLVVGTHLIWTARAFSPRKQTTLSKPPGLPQTGHTNTHTTFPKDLSGIIMSFEYAVLDWKNHPLLRMEQTIVELYMHGALSLVQAVRQIGTQRVRDSVPALISLKLAYQVYPYNPVPAAIFLFNFLQNNPTPSRRKAETMGTKGIERNQKAAFLFLSMAAERYEEFFQRAQQPRRFFANRRGGSSFETALLSVAGLILGPGFVGLGSYGLYAALLSPAANFIFISVGTVLSLSSLVLARRSARSFYPIPSRNGLLAVARAA